MMYLATYESVPEEGQPVVKGHRNVGAENETHALAVLQVFLNVFSPGRDFDVSLIPCPIIRRANRKLFERAGPSRRTPYFTALRIKSPFGQ
jgi:hypothetical protein